MNKKKIAIFDMSVTSDSPAGSCVLQMMDGLYKDYQFIVFADRFDNPAPKQIEWIQVSLPQKPVFLRYITFKWLASEYYQKYIRFKGKPQLIIATEGEFSNCNICYAHFCHRAYLQKHVIRGSRFRRLARFINHQFNANSEAEAFAYAQAIVVPSTGLADELTQTYGALVQQKITKIPNPVDVSSFTRPSSFNAQPLRVKLGFSLNDVVLVFVALGDFARKGLEPLLKALATLRDKNVKLLVVGGSQTEIREYELIREQLNLSDSAVFVGFQSDVRPYLWLSNLFILPSNYETFSLVTLQAAAAGLPIIATRLYGVEEFLQNEVNGWIIEHDVKSITETLQTILKDREKLSQIGTAASATASMYNQSIFIENWRSLLESLL